MKRYLAYGFLTALALGIGALVLVAWLMAVEQRGVWFALAVMPGMPLAAFTLLALIYWSAHQIDQPH